jgi:hypothetical protein
MFAHVGLLNTLLNESCIAPVWQVQNYGNAARLVEVPWQVIILSLGLMYCHKVKDCKIELPINSKRRGYVNSNTQTPLGFVDRR